MTADAWDGVAVAGLVLLAVGLYLTLGLGWMLAALGAALMAVAVVGARSKPKR